VFIALFSLENLVAIIERPPTGSARKRRRRAESMIASF
jgi:hypothetical protein